MGLGDVHLLAAVGAVLGPRDAALIFFIAPFLGLAYAAVSVGVARLAKGEVRVIPYGPYLAAASVVMMLAHQPILDFFAKVYR
jgi:leader peptidase (prepilin peptidase)/N-methyltransferase